VRLPLVLLLALSALPAAAAPNDAQTVAALDTAYQAAVKANDAETMAKILHPSMVVVLGNGAVVPRAMLIGLARNKTYTYEHQEEDPGAQTVRVFGDTATVTAKLWIKGVTANGQPGLESHSWFSDTYVRTAEGWRYAFGQATHPAN
jgi:ketosteroid isomerase-like protein